MRIRMARIVSNGMRSNETLITAPAVIRIWGFKYLFSPHSG